MRRICNLTLKLQKLVTHFSLRLGLELLGKEKCCWVVTYRSKSPKWSAIPYIEVVEEAPTALYSSWLGDWTLIGDNGVSNDVVIGRKVANKSINMYGLQNFPFAVVGDYSVERNDIVFSAQVVEQGYEFSDGSVADIHLLGLDEDGKYYGLDNGNYGIAIAGVLENNRRAIVRYGLNMPDYPKFVAMMVVAYMGGKYYSLGEDIAAFNGIAELAPASNTASVMPIRLHYSKGKLTPLKQPLRPGEQIDVYNF